LYLLATFEYLCTKTKPFSHILQKVSKIFFAHPYYSSFDLIEYHPPPPKKSVKLKPPGTNKEHNQRIKDGGVIPGE
jgi:hypothetical protein